MLFAGISLVATPGVRHIAVQFLSEPPGVTKFEGSFPVWLRCIPEIHRVGEDHIAFPDLVSALSRDPHAFFKTASGIK